MYSGSKKILAALVFACAASALHAQMIPGDMLAQLLRETAFSHVPQNEFNQAFQSFTKATYQGRNAFYQFEIEDVTASFVLYLYSSKTAEAWEKYSASPQTPPQASGKFQRTHRLTAELKLFTRQDGGSAVVATLAKGTAVQVESWGEYAELDKIIAKWAKVKTESGQSGWLWSGYLEEAK
jgi:hypothetical protein